MRHRQRIGRFPVQFSGASNPWRGAKEVSGVALVVAQEVPASSSMAIPHGPAGVGQARHRMREQLRGNGVSDAVVDDAVLILSELLSNACRHGRPLGRHTDVGDGDIRAAWRVDTGGLTVEVTDGGGPTRPVPATPSVTARGGRGLNIISALAQEWGVRDDSSGEVTVWALVSSKKPPGIGGSGSEVNGSGTSGPAATSGVAANGTGANGVGGLTGFEGLDFSDVLDDVG
ncbi:ATP-binding protein [Streptomyces sp. NPDC057718]|uniref:ATP-binding protein n=1 Tax=Streptomyces sp. NPDC057718 TaxID=3346225 RepID=UPI0036B6B1B3